MMRCTLNECVRVRPMLSHPGFTGYALDPLLWICDQNKALGDDEGRNISSPTVVNSI